MISIALAMLAQDVPLNAEASAAIECGRAVVATPPATPADAVSRTFQAVYFTMTAAAADPVKGLVFMDRTTNLAKVTFGDATLPGDRLNGILAQCDARYPLARGAAPAKLPADPFERDLMCMIATAYVTGIVRTTHLAMDLDRLERMQKGFLMRVPDPVLAAHGVNDATAETASNDVLQKTLRFGNLERVVQACSRELEGK
jgi:hypothetical protein